MPRVIGLVADDLTGACDAAAPFLRGGRVLVELWPVRVADSADDVACRAVSTDGRDLDPAQAQARAREATQRLLDLGARPYKKLDSRLRGHVCAELAGALEAWPGRALLCPALPAEGRVTAGGRQLAGEEVIELRPLIAGLEDRVEIRDAATEGDLDAVAAELVARPDVMPAGSAGLAAAMAGRLYPAARRSPGWRPARRPLGLVGSKTDISAEQLERARAEGWDIRHRSREDAVDPREHDALFLSGGGTAQGVLEALGARGVELLGEAIPRAPVGRVIGGRHEGLTVCVKSGGFGGPDAMSRIFATLVAGAATA